MQSWILVCVLTKWCLKTVNSFLVVVQHVFHRDKGMSPGGLTLLKVVFTV